jgi:thiol-disulfide isomerase/thioredoxin
LIENNYYQKGKKAPDFTLTDIDGNRVSLLKFRGKYVYIDFWATWCHPCMKELPHLIKLESDYTNKNVVFISIALDEDIVKIKTVLREHKIKGINLCVEKGINSNVANLYQIKDIPHFILIDKKGKMINYTASTPSSNQIRKVLDSLLLIK